MPGGSIVGFNVRAHYAATLASTPYEGGFAWRRVQVAMHLSNQGRNDIENSFRRPVVDLSDYSRTR
ncbi:hypothetical protein TMM008_61160 [Pseudomonas sp. 008]|nr:hypothetical protein TMM008_61160 [Pseudomonas sp. 008]